MMKMTTRLLLRFVAIAAVVSVTASGVLAQDDLNQLKPKKSSITLTLKKVTLSTALHALSDASGIDIEMSPEVSAVSAEDMNVNVHNAKFQDVFKMIADQAHLHYSVVDATTVKVSLT